MSCLRCSRARRMAYRRSHTCSRATGFRAKLPRLRDVRLRRGRWALTALLLIWLAVAYAHTHKSLPPGTHVAPEWQSVPLSALSFIADLTAADAYGRPIVSHAIFDAV